MCFRTVVLKKTLESPLDQAILKEINPEYSLERLMLKLKLQYFDHLMQGVDSLEKTLMLGKIEGKWRRGQQRMRLVIHRHIINSAVALVSTSSVRQVRTMKVFPSSQRLTSMVVLMVSAEWRERH